MSETDRQLIRQASLRNSGSSNDKRNNTLIYLSVEDIRKPRRTKNKVLLISLAVLVVVLALAGYLIFSTDHKEDTTQVQPPDPVEPPKPSASKLYVFKEAAVCTDAAQCSTVGKHVLSNNGSAVDAIIAIMFCNSLLNQQSMGMGGGFLMTVYIRDEKKAYIVNAREKAPLKATVHMFSRLNNNSFSGPQTVGVPGELRGMWLAHQRWGKLPWADLLNPTLDICNKGYVMSQHQYRSLNKADKLNHIKKDVNFKEMYVSPSGEFYRPGTVVKPSKALCRTFARIAKHGGDELYNGTLAKDFFDDLKEAGTIITAEDLENYEAKISEPLAVPLADGDVLYAPLPPGSGIILADVLNILSGYQFNASSISTTENQILTYHRIIEAFKYAYATRAELGDIDFLDLQELISNVTSPEYGNEIRLRINDTWTSNDAASYGATEFGPPDDFGTAHISIIAGNGDAVSLTSSINFYFGAGFTTRRTGIVMNNVMDDFSSPGHNSMFMVKPSPANYIAPGKRPLSSMSPTIIVDKNGNTKLAIGAAGGTKITTSLAMVIIRKLWFDQTIKEAVDEERLHHQLHPMLLMYPDGFSEGILKGLRDKGHEIQLIQGNNSISVVCALYRNKTAIYGNADFRKGGNVDGID